MLLTIKTMDETQLQDLISTLLKNEIQNQLKLVGPARGFNGQKKPVSNKFPTPISNKLDTGTLYNSIDVYFEPSQEGSFRIVVEAAPYWRYVEFGRKPGKYPPLSAMLSWVQSKPALNSPELSLKQRAFLAGRSIAEYGIYPTPFIKKGFEEAQDKIKDYLGQWAVEYFTNYLEEKKIIIKIAR